MGKKRGWATWFTSDIHIGHENILDFCDRPYENIEDMKNDIRKKWNEKVAPEDQVIVVGDVFFYHTKEEAKKYMDSLNGTKILVRGNHDRKTRDMYAMGFSFVCEEMTMAIANERVSVSHFPFRASIWTHWFYNLRHKLFTFLGIKGKSWKLDKRYYERRPKNHGQFLIHGHTHSEEKVRDRMLHVGWDAWKSPVSVGEIGNLITKIRGDQNKKGK
jgi:calcineurin-like phosphoesterase family protein